MFRSSLIAAVAALSAVVSAQNYSTSGNLSIDASQISSTLRQNWCNAQLSSCPKICGGVANPNTCDSNTLDWACECASGNTPNISDYQTTMPFFVCEQWISNCVDNHPDDLDGQAGCRSVTCGQEMVPDETTATTSSAAETATEGPTSTSSGEATPTESAGSESASPSTSDSAAIAMHVASSYGTGIVFTGLLALFGLAL